MTNLLVDEGPSATLPPSNFGARTMAAVLDAVVGYGVLWVSVVGWAFIGDVDTTEELPVWAVFVAFGVIWLYITVTTHRGGTLGMRALRLRLISVGTEKPPSLTRAAIRAALLLSVALVWLLWWGWWFPVAYLASMLLLPGRQLPHDLATRTAMVSNDVIPLLSRLPWSSANSPKRLQPEAAKELLGDLEKLQQRPQRELHLISVPVIIMGVIAVASGLLDAVYDHDILSTGSRVFWALAPAMALAATLLWYRRQRKNHGVGVGGGDLVVIGALVGCVSIPFAFFVFFAGPVIIGMGFLALAINRRSPMLGTAAVGFAAVMLAEHMSAVFANLLGVPGVSGIALGVLLIGAGALTFRRELTR